MRKSYIVFKDKDGKELETKVSKGYKSLKGFKRYNLRHSLIGLQRETRAKWFYMDIYSYETFKNLIRKELEYVGKIDREEYKTYARNEAKKIEEKRKERRLKECYTQTKMTD